MKKCNKCKKEQDESKFGKNKGMPDGFRSTCKECRRIPKELQKINSGRFSKGLIPWNRGIVGVCKSSRKGIKTGQIPWNKGIRLGTSRRSRKANEWAKKVKERDGWKCTKCGSEKRLHAHHILPWKDKKELRFDVNNGITLCPSCHAKIEGYQVGHRHVKSNRWTVV